jgi:hypothetical protein
MAGRLLTTAVMDHCKSLSVPVRVMLFAALVLGYVAQPVLGWAMMVLVGLYAIVCTIRRGQRGSANVGQHAR